VDIARLTAEVELLQHDLKEAQARAEEAEQLAENTRVNAEALEFDDDAGMPFTVLRVIGSTAVKHRSFGALLAFIGRESSIGGLKSLAGNRRMSMAPSK